MDTWVLVVISIVNSQPVGIATVPGYSSQQACLTAGKEFKNLENRGSYGMPRREAVLLMAQLSMLVCNVLR